MGNGGLTSANAVILLQGDATPGDQDGIATVAASKKVEGKIYNLSGQQVNANFKGVVIENGKKVIKK